MGRDLIDSRQQLSLPQAPISFSSNKTQNNHYRNLRTFNSGGRNQQPLYLSQVLDPTYSMLYDQPNVSYDAYNHTPLAAHLNQPVQRSAGVSNVRELQGPHTLPLDFKQMCDENSNQQQQSHGLNGARRPAHQLSDPLPHDFHTPIQNITDSPSSPLTQVSSPSFQASQRRLFHSSYGNKTGPVQFGPLRPMPSFDEPTPKIPKIGSQNPRAHHAPPIVQGIELISLNQLPDRFRSLFSFPLFNAIQSKCFNTAYKSNDNLVVSAPTGGGKTAILEMAICRLVSNSDFDQYKIVYMAPTKSLCSERQREWQLKFAPLDLQCAELTGDTDQAQLRHVQNSHIIITTPEKWDSMTRKWKDHIKLVQLVKLFLIDEVHILKDTRGATLEAVVSRMKTVGSDIRFLALSATVPNSEDIATWLGRDHCNQHLPARREVFGEDFRPVKLQKFVYALPYKGNDFGFENVCDSKLPELIAKHSQKKPMMIFCMTRKSTVTTAKLLVNMWANGNPRDRQWSKPNQKIMVQDPELKSMLSFGVAFHHAGLDTSDRQIVEKGFLDGQIHVICCTSTLAVGINLPCHLVIIKNTVSFQDEGLKEYADLEIMQMLGRAGRPQFDDSAVALIITKEEKAKKYEKMVSGTELLESCLHLNLIDHLNAEIGLQTIYNNESAKMWLAGTFLFVRLRKNPDYYKLDGDAVEQHLEDRMESICQRDISLLKDTKLVSSKGRLRCTEFGEAMARYYIRFETMRVFLSLGPCSKTSDILSALVAAEELSEVRLRCNEKKLYKEINKANGIKFPIKVDIALASHKRSLIIQAELGSVDFPGDEPYAKHKKQYQQDKGVIFSHIARLIRCIIDCQIHLQDGVAVRHALELLRSLNARAWDNSPYQMKQLTQIGPVAVRKLALGGINSIEALEAAESHRIEILMGKNPPFGIKLLANLKDFPKLRVSVKMMGKDCKQGQAVKIKLKIECGFLNERAPIFFSRKQIFICLLVERSDGFLVDFKRMSSRKLSNGEDILLTADLLCHTQYITCYVMCDEIAGTLRYAELRPNLPSSIFPTPDSSVQDQKRQQYTRRGGVASSHGGEISSNSSMNFAQSDEFSDGEIDDQDFVDAVDEMDFNHVDNYESSTTLQTHLSKPYLAINKQPAAEGGSVWNPTQLSNGKWACNHKCKDKSMCKHLCCREGLEKVPKPPRNSISSPSLPTQSKTQDIERVFQTKGQISLPIKTQGSRATQKTDQSRGLRENQYPKFGPRDYRKLHNLHNNVNKGPPVPPIIKTKPSFSYAKGDPPHISFLSCETNPTKEIGKTLNNLDDDWVDGLPSLSTILTKKQESSDLVSTEISPKRTGVESDKEFSDFDDNLMFSEVFESDSNLKRGFNDTKVRDHGDDKSGDNENMPTSTNMVTPTRHENQELSVESSDRLFCSTDSHGKPAQPRIIQTEALSTRKSKGTEKRVGDNALEAEISQEDSHVPKRLKTITQNQDVSLQPSNVSADQSQSQKTVECMKIQNSGRPWPAWVNEFDPKFIAEYAGFVEFI